MPEKCRLFVAAAAGAAGALALASLLRRRRRKRIEIVSTKAACPPAGHYAQATVYGDRLYVSGLLPVTAEAERLEGAPFEAQAALVLRNLGAVLEAAGADASRLISTRVYIADIDNWPAFNKMYAEFCGDHRPARAVVPVPHLHYGLALEVEAIAAL